MSSVTNARHHINGSLTYQLATGKALDLQILRLCMESYRALGNDAQPEKLSGASESATAQGEERRRR
jgi:hypothetical protein